VPLASQLPGALAVVPSLQEQMPLRAALPVLPVVEKLARPYVVLQEALRLPEAASAR
jgi:hypothetical protein